MKEEFGIYLFSMGVTPSTSAFKTLYDYRLEQALITLAVLDYNAFCYLLKMISSTFQLLTAYSKDG